jgi:hypothetical protein
MDEAGSGDQVLILVVVFCVPVEVGDIGSDQHEVAVFYEADLVADEAGAFGLVDQDEFVFFVEMPGFVKVVTFPIYIYKGRVG